MLILALAFAVSTSAPPLSPEAAVAVLRGSQSISDRTNARSYPEPAPSVAVPTRPGDGPFGELRSTPMPVSCCSVYKHRTVASRRTHRLRR
jgi:hypothetical protein